MCSFEWFLTLGFPVTRSSYPKIPGACEQSVSVDSIVGEFVSHGIQRMAHYHSP